MEHRELLPNTFLLDPPLQREEETSVASIVEVASCPPCVISLAGLATIEGNPKSAC
jgi:hypothetical protein